MTTSAPSKPIQPQPTPIPVDLRKELPDYFIPWGISKRIFDEMKVQKSKSSYKKVQVLPSDPEWRFIWRYFHFDKPRRYGIKRIHCIHERHQQQVFELNLSSIERETKTFKPNWEKEPRADQRAQTIERWRQATDCFSPFNTMETDGRRRNWEGIKVLPLWHGSSEDICTSIAKSGFVYFGKTSIGKAAGGPKSTDEGLFGSGIYFTNSARYASDIYSKGHLLLAWVSMREPFPVVGDPTQADMKTLKKMGAYKDYNAHYVPVSSVDPCKPYESYYYPRQKGQDIHCDEIVVFHKSQAIPRFWIELQVETPYLMNPSDIPQFVDELIPHFLKLLQNPHVDRDKKLRKHLGQELGILLKLQEEDHLKKRHKTLYTNLTQLLNAQRKVNRQVRYKLTSSTLSLSQKPTISPPPLQTQQSSSTSTHFSRDVKSAPLSHPSSLKGLSKGYSHQLLLKASKMGDLPTVEALLHKGISPDIGKKESEVPLFSALEAKNSRVFQRLIEARANIWVLNGDQNLAEGICLICNWPIPEKMSVLEQLAKRGLSLHPALQAAICGYVSVVLSTTSTEPPTDKNGNGLMHYACANGQVGVAKALNQRGTKVSEKNSRDATPLHFAAQNGHLEVVQWLLGTGGASITEKDNDGWTALLLAAQNGQLETVQWLLGPGGAKITEKTKNGWTALLLAAFNGQLETVQWLLGPGGAKITEKTKDGWTALLAAAFNGQLETVQWLLGPGGAKITEKDNDGLTALLKAAQNGQLGAVQWLLGPGGAKITEKAKNGLTALLLAACNGQLETVQWLLGSGGAKITEKAKNGWTALLWAACNGQLGTVQWLLGSGGAKITEKDKTGWTALLWAAGMGQLGTVQWLLGSGGTKITEKDKKGLTALLAATQNGQLETVQWLLGSGGAKITERDKKGFTALLWAAGMGQLEIVQWLLGSGGAKITEKDKTGWTALLLAACNGQLGTVQWLLTSGGAKITEKNNAGKNAIDLATDETVKKYLMSFKASSSQTTSLGNTTKVHYEEKKGSSK